MCVRPTSQEEEESGDSSEDVTQELRRVLELDQSEGGEEGESEGRGGVAMDTPDRPDNPVLSGVCVNVCICEGV